MNSFELAILRVARQCQQRLKQNKKLKPEELRQIDITFAWANQISKNGNRKERFSRAEGQCRQDATRISEALPVLKWQGRRGTASEDLFGHDEKRQGRRDQAGQDWRSPARTDE